MKDIITVENLSKKYMISHQAEGPAESLKEAITNQFHRLFKRNERSSKTYEEFWAIQDLNFSVQEGDRVGVIGRNGAGKSTLLKILSRITEPTKGRVKICGRTASLLEVSTGFHPELTGRENIFLNGAILGMSHREIVKRFDEIVAFSEIDQFLDTPVKRFSSGMFARLGFAIAAHLDTDLLIIDEVLSVGDAQFQEKCFKKMNEIGSKGRTILFVSHNVGAVLALCNKAIYLEKGRMKKVGNVEECVNAYEASCPKASLSWQGNLGDDNIKILHAEIRKTSDKEYFYQGEKAVLDIEYELLNPRKDLILGLGIWNVRNQLLAKSRLSDVEECLPALRTLGKHRVSFSLDSSLFHEGEYLIKIDCSLAHQKIINDEISLKFPVYPKNDKLLYQHSEKEGISLGNRWITN